jgi:hypothetical protein
MVEEMAELKNKIDMIEMDEERAEEEMSTLLQEKLTTLAKQKHNDALLSSQIRNRLEGEVITKYWTGINKPHREILVSQSP